MKSLSNRLPITPSPLWQQLKNYPLQLTLIVVWVVLMLLVPRLGWSFGERAMTNGITASTLAQAVAVISILRLRWGWGRIGRILATVAIITFSAEAIGTATGFPFGSYTYTKRLQPQLLHVPLLIPVAWFMMLPSCWIIAQRWQHSRWQFAAVSAAALTSWDLLLDPQMVYWNLWQWTTPSGYFGIPWSNFVGWLGTAFLLTFILYPQLNFRDNRPQTTDHGRKFTIHNSQITIHNFLLLTVFTLTWFLEIIGLTLIFSLPAPGLIGGFIMGIFVLIGWRTHQRPATSN